MSGGHHDPAVDDSIDRLANMGFDRSAAESAYKTARGDVQVAANILASDESSRPPLRARASPKATAPITSDLDAGTHLDVRDTVGKWLEAKIISAHTDGTLEVHYLGWDGKWNEQLHLNKDYHRLADFRKYSEGQRLDPRYQLNQQVEVWARRPRTGWVKGQIAKIDGLQCKVQYTVLDQAKKQPKKFQHWFHFGTDEIHPLEQQQQVQRESEEAREQRARRLSAGVAKVAGKWFVEQYIEVRDTANRWLPAIIIQTDPEKRMILIHFCSWSSKWDEWLHVVQQADRIKPLGQDIADTVEIAQAKKDDIAFRDALTTQGFQITEVARDGNCLFRSVAHQMYNDVERHGEIRRQCYDHMERDRAFFASYIAEDFDTYVKRNRKLNEWGDHVELFTLREMFNVNMNVYAKNNVTGPKPLALDSLSGNNIPTMRLSYHGKNHYNSIVDAKMPPPLHTTKPTVDLRHLRLAEEQKSCSEPVRKQHMTRKDSAELWQRSLIGNVLELDMSELSPFEFHLLWKKYDQAQTGFIAPQKVHALVQEVMQVMFEKILTKRKTLNQETESTGKSYDELKSFVEDHHQDVSSLYPKGMAQETFKSHLTRLLHEMSWMQN